jgi:GTP:adenosylcobinamide-phosphate guanylyltransferase
LAGKSGNMKAIILSAGQGSRLGALTNDRPKCLIPFAGRSLLDRLPDTKVDEVKIDWPMLDHAPSEEKFGAIKPIKNFDPGG